MDLKNYLQQEEFIVKCECGVSLMDARLQMINAELGMRCKRKVIHSFSSRIKSYDSIAAKLRRKGLEETVESMEQNLNDLIGVRAVCTYTDDLYQIAEMLRAQKDLRLIKEKDYVKTPKKKRLSKHAPDLLGSHFLPGGCPVDQGGSAAADRGNGLLGRLGLSASV